MIALLLVLAAAPFNRTTIHRVVNKHAGDLQECADKEAFPSDGMMEMTFVVNTEGHVTDITGEATSITHSGELFQCVAQKLRTWSFPSPGKKNATVKHFRFVFPPK